MHLANTQISLQFYTNKKKYELYFFYFSCIENSGKPIHILSKAQMLHFVVLDSGGNHCTQRPPTLDWVTTIPAPSTFCYLGLNQGPQTCSRSKCTNHCPIQVPVLYKLHTQAEDLLTYPLVSAYTLWIAQDLQILGYPGVVNPGLPIETDWNSLIQVLAGDICDKVFSY